MRLVFQKREYFLRFSKLAIFAGLIWACAAPPPSATPSPTMVIPSTPTQTSVALPDLTITTISLVVDPEDMCQPLSGHEWVQIHLANLGEAAANVFSVTMNGKTQIIANGLPANGQAEIKFPGYVSQINAKIDSENQVIESDEGNNTFKQEIPLPTVHPTCLLQPTQVIPSLLPSAILEGHSARVWSVTFSPDGALVASGSVDNTLRLWRVAPASLLRTMRGHPFPVLSVKFSPNGITLATGSADGAIRLWQVSNGRLLATLSGHAGSVTKVAISNDDQTLASCGEDFTVRLWRMADGFPIEIIDEGLAAINDLAFTTDGQSLAWAENTGTLRLRSLEGKWLHIFKYDEAAATSLAFSADGRWLAAGYANGRIIIWDLADGARLQSLSSHGKQVSSLAFSSDGRWLVSGSHDMTIALWRINQEGVEELPEVILVGHTDRINSIDVSPRNDLVVSGSDDKTIRLWPLPDDELHSQVFDLNSDNSSNIP